MRPSEIKHWLERGGIHLSRGLGQNFLHEPRYLDRIVEAAGLEPGERVLEIGPGLGPLTERLLAAHCEVTAIEMDRRIASLLEQRLGKPEHLDLIQADALAWVRGGHWPWPRWKVVSNLPYSVASPLLVELAQAVRGPESMTVTVQWEVARRLVAQAGTSDYGLLTLLVRRNYTADGIFKIPPGCFFPPPKVDSACVTFHRRTRSALHPGAEETYERLVRLGFSQRRKIMRKLLLQQFDETDLDRAYRSLNLDAKTRAERVTFPQFVALANQLAPTRQDGEIFDVVDENDVVTGQAPRREVHARGLRHRAAHILVFRPDGRLYLQRRSAIKDTAPGTWDTSAAGHVDAGESYEDCALRELGEELGIQGCPAPTELFRIDACEATGQEFTRVYRLDWDGPVTPDPVEIESGDWFTLESIVEWLARSPEEFAPAFRRVWQEADARGLW